MSSQSPHQYFWYCENSYCRACWQNAWLVSVRGHVCGLKINDNQFVTSVSSSSQSLSSTASFSSFFLVPSLHTIFSSHLHLLPLQKKSSFAMLTSVENSITGRRRVKASEMFLNLWLRGLRLPDNASLCSVFQAICRRILLMKKNKWKPIFVYFSLFFTQTLLRRTGKLSANILAKQTEYWFFSSRTNVQI